MAGGPIVSTLERQPIVCRLFFLTARGFDSHQRTQYQEVVLPKSCASSMLLAMAFELPRGGVTKVFCLAPDDGLHLRLRAGLLRVPDLPGPCETIRMLRVGPFRSGSFSGSFSFCGAPCLSWYSISCHRNCDFFSEPENMFCNFFRTRRSCSSSFSAQGQCKKKTIFRIAKNCFSQCSA